MNDFVIYTDSACDIPPELLKEWGVPYSWLTYVFDGDARQYSNYELPFPEFYDKMRKGSVARTSAVNADAFVQGFEPILQEGKDILYIGFSSGLSSTYHAGCIAAQELREKYPERDIRCVDTLGASGGFGLLLYMAVQKKREGGTIEECEKVVLDNRFHLCHWFTVDDLVYLKRGGRISAATAFVGNTLGFKPVLHMDDAGHLINMFKVRGRKASLNAMADKYGELALDKAGRTVFISHGDCRADADTLAAILKERYGASVKEIVVVGPVIGAPSGPGTLALLCLGEHRSHISERNISMIDYRYDTQLLIEGTDLDEDAINDYFRTNFQGDCLLAVGDDELIKIHYHTNEPWKVLEYCASLGEIFDIVVEDMDRQARGLNG